MWLKGFTKDGVIEQDKDARPMSDEQLEDFMLDAEVASEVRKIFHRARSCCSLA